MKNKVRFKIIINSSITKIILIVLIILSLFLAVLLPSILLRSPKGSVTSYNRDSASGTREAFAEKVLGDKEFVPGYNVREVNNNDAMVRAVSKNSDSVGYVSLGTIATFDEEEKNTVISDEYKDTISFVSFESTDQLTGLKTIVSPTIDTISDGSYQPSRNFNMFFRVEEGSLESNITLYDWTALPDEQEGILQNEIQSLDPNLLMSYLFMSWSLHSKEAQESLNANGEIPPPSDDSSWEEDKTMLNNYILYTGLDDSEETTVEIVGSSSATPIIKEMSELFEETMMNEHGLNVEFIISTNGSGDAFKKTIPGTNNPYIGIQSRSPHDSELESWGWDTETKGSVYDTFAIDAILIIYNLETNDPDNTINLLDDNLYTNSEMMLNLYTANEYVFYGDIFLEYEVEGGYSD